MHTKNDQPKSSKLWYVVLTSSLSSLIEWYDLQLFGTLVAVFAFNYFSKEDESFSFLSSLITFGIAMVIRPIGGLFLGWMGDSVGRKNTFLITLVLMGGATSAIGLLPTYEQASGFAIFFLLVFRMIQGFAFGGEYGAAVILTAEHAPYSLRGLYTGILQSTASLGFALAILVNILLIRVLGQHAFFTWGWRISFLISLFLVVISYLLRKNLQEPPEFHKLRIAGMTSQNPIYESFKSTQNLKKILLVLFGPLAAQGVFWYTAYVYSYFFINKSLGLNFDVASELVLIAIVLAAPFNVVFGYLSDKFGRLPFILGALFLSIIILFPSFYYLNYFSKLLLAASDPSEIFKYKCLMVAVLFSQGFCVTMIYGPMAAFLVDLFPMRIRFTSLSFPYHVANGVFGSSVPLVVMIFSLSDHPDDIMYSGLYYPFFICVVSFTLTLIFYKSPLLNEKNVI